MLRTLGSINLIDSLLNMAMTGEVQFVEGDIKIPLPGIGKENIKVTLIPDKKLTVEYKKDDRDKVIAFNVQGYDDATAEYKDGMLVITPQLKEGQAGKSIKIT